MKLIVLLAVVSCSYAAKLDRTYLPPPGAITSGGDAESLFVPLGPKSSEGTIGKPQDKTPNQYFSISGNQRAMQRPIPSEKFGDTQGIFTGENTREVTIPASKAGLHDTTSIPSSTFNDNQRPIQRPMAGDRSGNFLNIYQEDNLSDIISPVSRAGLKPNVENQSDKTLDFSQDPSRISHQNSDNLTGLKGTVPENPVNKTFSPNKPTYTERENKPERAQAANDRAAEIIRYDTKIDGDSYHYSYETSNGISAEEKGVATNGVQAEGSYSYTGDDGKFYSVTYTADENGFQPHGDHLPTSPPIPEFILKSIEENANAVASSSQDDPSRKDYINASGQGNVSSNQYTDDHTQANNESPRKRPDQISPSSYQYKLDQPNFDEGSTSTDFKEAVHNLSSRPSQTYFEKLQNSDNLRVQPTLSSAAQPNPVIEQNDFSKHLNTQKSKTEFPDYINNEKSNMNIFQHYDTLGNQYNPSQNRNTPSGSGNPRDQPSQTFDSISSQTSRAPINVPQQYNIRDETHYTTPSNMISQNNNVQSSVKTTNVPNLHNGEEFKSQYNKVVSQNFPEINFNDHKTEHKVPEIVKADTKNYQYASPKSQVLQNSRPNNSFLRYQPQQVSNDSQRKQHTSHTDVSNNGNTNYDFQVPQHNTPNYSLQIPQQLNKLKSTPESLYNQSNLVSSLPTSQEPHFSTGEPEGYYYNPPSPSRPQFTDLSTLNARPGSHFSQNTSPESHQSFTNSKNIGNIASKIPITPRPQYVAPNTQANIFSESKSTQYTPTDFKYNPSQNIPSNDQTPQFSHEQSHTYPITTPIIPTNQVHDSSYHTRKNNIHPQSPHAFATTVQNSRQPVQNYQQQKDEGYQYNRPQVQGIDYNSSKGINNLSNFPNSDDNHNFYRAQGRESYPTSSSSEYYPDSNTEGNNNIPNIVNKTDNISSADKDESLRQYNGKNDLKPSSIREDFSGPRQTPSYSDEEGYKY